MAKFYVLQSAKVPDSKISKHQNEAFDEALKNQMINILEENPSIAQRELAKVLRISKASVQRIMSVLGSQGKMERVGGRRYGH